MSFHQRLAAAVLLVVSSAGAQTLPATLTEDDALRIALASPNVVSFNAAQVDLARSEVRREGIWPNPTVEFTREAAGEIEDFLTLSQSFDLSGRRALRRRAAQLRVEAMESDVTTQQLDLTRLVRAEFNRVINQQELVAALTDWSRRIRDAATTAGRLQAGGEVSGYDRRRLERESVGAEARLAVERATLVAAQRRLASLLGVSNLDGTALQRPTQHALPDDGQLLALIEQRPDVTALARRIEAARLDLRVAQKWRIPTLDLTGGVKMSDADSGGIFGVGVGLPIFNRNQEELLRAKSAVTMLTAQRSILLARALGEVSGLSIEARELRSAARRFREEAVPLSTRLTTTAEAAYRAGEVGILELLDAYRTALDAAAEASELEQRAREAEIELSRTLGERNQ